jgi:hypothetical protein
MSNKCRTAEKTVKAGCGSMELIFERYIGRSCIKRRMLCL